MSDESSSLIVECDYVYIYLYIESRYYVKYGLALFPQFIRSFINKISTRKLKFFSCWGLTWYLEGGLEVFSWYFRAMFPYFHIRCSYLTNMAQGHVPTTWWSRRFIRFQLINLGSFEWYVFALYLSGGLEVRLWLWANLSLCNIGNLALFYFFFFSANFP